MDVFLAKGRLGLVSDAALSQYKLQGAVRC